MTLLKMCNDLLELFGWPEYSDSDIKFRKATVLRELGKTKEAVEFCENGFERNRRMSWRQRQEYMHL